MVCSDLCTVVLLIAEHMESFIYQCLYIGVGLFVWHSLVSRIVSNHVCMA